MKMDGGGRLCCTDKGLLNFHMEAAAVEWDLTPAALLVLWLLSQTRQHSSITAGTEELLQCDAMVGFKHPHSTPILSSTQWLSFLSMALFLPPTWCSSGDAHKGPNPVIIYTSQLPAKKKREAQVCFYKKEL